MSQDIPFPAFLDRVVDFPESNTSYELLKPLTSLRSCHDGAPPEARMVFTCRRVKSASEGKDDDIFIMKVKVQEPGYSETPHAPELGPSTTTNKEIEALQKFAAAGTPYAPHLVTWRRGVQSEGGLLKGGFLTYLVMTKMPGDTLWDLGYWGIGKEEREEMVASFLTALRSLYTIGVEPIDRALRNVIFDRETRKSIIDFELWQETGEMFTDETRMLERWGLVQAPPAKTWFEAWNAHHR